MSAGTKRGEQQAKGRKSLLKVWHALKRENLLKALRALENKCLPPTRGAITISEGERILRCSNAGELRCALEGMTFWPLKNELKELTHAVIDLSVIGRIPKKPTAPVWKRFKVVNTRWPGFQLVSRVEQLVQRARNRLKETGGSGFDRLRREANDRAPEAIQLRKDLRAFYEASCNASKVKWRDNERDIRCYERALELIVDQQDYEALLMRVEPLLSWIAGLGNPAFMDLLIFDDLTKRACELMALGSAAEAVKRKREQAKQRQSNRRLRLKERENRLKKQKRQKFSR
jgi:hypothetical protein